MPFKMDSNSETRSSCSRRVRWMHFAAEGLQLPVTLLSALIAVSVFATGNHLTLDSRAAGLAVALVLVAVRAPFLVVVVAACAAAAGVHAL